MHKQIIILFLVLVLSVSSLSCNGREEQPKANLPKTELNNLEVSMKLYIDDILVSVKWEDNESVKVLQNLLKDKPLNVNTSMYGNFEQVGDLNVTLLSTDKQISTSAGDIVLYSKNKIVIFYGTNTWSYTKLGHITDKTQEELKLMLSKPSAQIKLTL